MISRSSCMSVPPKPSRLHAPITCLIAPPHLCLPSPHVRSAQVGSPRASPSNHRDLAFVDLKILGQDECLDIKALLACIELKRVAMSRNEYATTAENTVDLVFADCCRFSPVFFWPCDEQYTTQCKLPRTQSATSSLVRLSTVCNCDIGRYLPRKSPLQFFRSPRY